MRMWVLEFCLESVRAWWSYGRGCKERKTDTEAVVWMCYVHTSRWVCTREGHCVSFSIALYLTTLRQGVSLKWKFTGVLFLFSFCLVFIIVLCVFACLLVLLGWPESSRNLPVSSLQFWGYRHAQPCSDFSMSPGNLNSGHYPCMPSSVIHWATPLQPHGPSFKKSKYFLYILLSITTHTAGCRYTHAESQSSREVCVLVLPQRNFSSFISLSLASSRSPWCSQLPSDTLPLSWIINWQESSCQWTRPLEYQEAEKLDIHPKLNRCLIISRLNLLTQYVSNAVSLQHRRGQQDGANSTAHKEKMMQAPRSAPWLPPKQLSSVHSSV